MKKIITLVAAVLAINAYASTATITVKNCTKNDSTHYNCKSINAPVVTSSTHCKIKPYSLDSWLTCQGVHYICVTSNEEESTSWQASSVSKSATPFVYTCTGGN